MRPLYQTTDSPSAPPANGEFASSILTMGSTLDIDQSETAVATLLSGLSKKELRESSYAGIVYHDLRCALVHEYSLSGFLEAYPQAMKTNKPSYVNLLIAPDDAVVRDAMKQHGLTRADALVSLATQVRHLHLPYSYLRVVLTGVADNVFSYWDSSKSWNQVAPVKWWADG